MPLDVRNIGKILLYSIAIGVVLVVAFPSRSIAQEATEPKSIRMTCGACPDGYATTGTPRLRKSAKTEIRLSCNVCRWGQTCWAYADPAQMAMPKSEAPQFLLGVGTRMVAG